MSKDSPCLLKKGKPHDYKTTKIKID